MHNSAVDNPFFFYLVLTLKVFQHVSGHNRNAEAEHVLATTEELFGCSS